MQNFMIALLVCSITMSLLALLYIAITPIVSKRYSAKGRYYAWLIIVVGLIIPFRPQWGSAFVTVDVLSRASAPAIPSVSMPMGLIPAGSISVGSPPTGSMLEASTGNGAIFHVPYAVENGFSPVGDTVFHLATASIPWWQIGFAVWLFGMIAFFIIQAIKHYRFVRMAKRWNESITDERIISIFQNLKNEMGISKKISLYQNSDMGSPIMYGFVNPCIILPTVKQTEDELHFILKHELVHFKRKDLCYKFLVLIATAMHWFNPLVYLAARAIRLNCELSCDDEVVRNTDADTRLHYTETIIGVVKYRSKLKIALSTNFYGGKRGMKNRISSIMDTKKKRAGVLIACVVLILTLGASAVFAANASNPPVSNALSAEATVSDEGLQVFSLPNEHLRFLEHAKMLVARFEIYRDFGLVYEPDSNHLYFNGELVRYFEDVIVIDVSMSASMSLVHFVESGTVDVRAVRDVSQLVFDGQLDLSVGLFGLELFSQEEFDARDIDAFLNPSLPSAIAVDVYPTSVSGISVTMPRSATTEVSMYPTSEGGIVVGNDRVVFRYGQTYTAFQGVVVEGNAMVSGNVENATLFSLDEVYYDWQAWGLTIDNVSVAPNGRLAFSTPINIFYRGQLVRQFADSDIGFWISSDDHSGNISVNVIRDENMNIIGLDVVQA